MSEFSINPDLNPVVDNLQATISRILALGN